jgi:phage shock protein C
MKQLYRPKNNRMLGGVCAGLGEHLDVDPTVIRRIRAVVSVLSIGTGIFIYILAWIIIPEKTPVVQGYPQEDHVKLPDISSFTGAYTLRQEVP